MELVEPEIRLRDLMEVIALAATTVGVRGCLTRLLATTRRRTREEPIRNQLADRCRHRAESRSVRPPELPAQSARRVLVGGMPRSIRRALQSGTSTAARKQRPRSLLAVAGEGDARTGIERRSGLLLRPYAAPEHNEGAGDSRLKLWPDTNCPFTSGETRDVSIAALLDDRLDPDFLCAYSEVQRRGLRARHDSETDGLPLARQEETPLTPYFRSLSPEQATADSKRSLGQRRIAQRRKGDHRNRDIANHEAY